MKNIVLILFFVYISLTCYGQQADRLGGSEILDFCFTPSGSFIYTAGTKGIEAWNFRERSHLSTLSDNRNIPFLALDLSRDTAWLAATCLDSSLYVYNLVSNTPVHIVRLGSIGNTVKFCPGTDGILVGTRNGELLKYSLPDLRLMEKYTLCSGEITSIAIADSSGFLATGGSDQMVRLLDYYTFHPIDSIQKHKDWIRELAFDQKGYRLYSAGDDGKVLQYSVSHRQIELEDVVNNDFTGPWILSLDTRPQDCIAYATHSGRITVITPFNHSRFKCKEEVFRIRFVPRTYYISIVAATRNGLRVIQANELMRKGDQYRSN